MRYNQLDPAVVAELRGLRFTAASSDGVDDPFFRKFRIEHGELNDDENGDATATESAG